MTSATKLKRIGTAQRRAASSCNAFAIATFSSLPMHFSQKWRRRRPSNLYAMFGHSESFKSQPRDLAYPSRNFYRGSKSANFDLILNVAQASLKFEDAAFKNGASYLNSETNWVSRDDGRMSSPRLVKFGPRTPEILSCECDPLQNFTAILC